MSTNQFVSYEVVLIGDGEQTRADNMVGEEGAILGMGQDDQGNWFYAVQPYNPCFTCCYYIPEHLLIKTGRFDKEETFYSGDSVKVRVNPETGAGEIVE